MTCGNKFHCEFASAFFQSRTLWWNKIKKKQNIVRMGNESIIKHNENKGVKKKAIIIIMMIISWLTILRDYFSY